MSLPTPTGDSGNTGPPTGGECTSCPHPMSAHDPISARFCGATAAGGYHRGCVCTPVPAAPR
jgi:hypothetical protein